MTENDLRERLEIFGYKASDDYSHFHYIKASMLGADLDTHDGGLELLQQAQKWGCDLVVIDTMSRAVSGDENDADTVRRFYQHTGRLLKANGIAWLRIDHAGKNRDRGQRGSSSKNDDVDVVWLLERSDAGAVLTLTHSRVFWMDPTIPLANTEPTESGGIVHIRSKSAGYPSGVSEQAAQWQKLGIPLDASRRQASAPRIESVASEHLLRRQAVRQRGIHRRHSGWEPPAEPGNNVMATWENSLWNQFRITANQWEWMAEQRDGCCWLCGFPGTARHVASGEVQRLAVDHDHACCPENGKSLRGDADFCAVTATCS